MIPAATTFRYEGVIPILATPFHDDESLDLPSLRRVIRFLKAVDVDALTLMGVMGEANRLIDRERDELLAVAAEEMGDMPLVVGITHTGTAAAVALCRQAEKHGAAAVMVTPSKQQVPGDAAVLEYFQRVGTAISIPIIIQDHPTSSDVHMSTELILRIIQEVPRVGGIKAEALPTPPKVRALLDGMKNRARTVPVMTGLGALYALFDLEAGSVGLQTGFAFPEILQAMLAHHRAGDRAALHRLYATYLPLIVYEQQPGMALRKELMRRRGLIASNRVRHPGGSLHPLMAEQLTRLLETLFPGQDLTRPLQLV